MPNIVDSVSCCKRFADKYEKVTGKKYRKNDSGIYDTLNQFGDFKTALSIAERREKSAGEKGQKPSEAISVTVVHHLVKEILDKIE